MGLIKGETITLIERTKTGTDDFGQDIFTEASSEVENVLVTVDSESVMTDYNIHGRRQTIKIGIPKGDTHNWDDASIIWHGNTYRIVGDFITGNENLIPLDWKGTRRAERYA